MAEAPPLSQILQTFESGSQRVNRLATELSRRIETFENWLNELPGKVEADHWITWGTEPFGDEQSLGINFGRSGKRWILSFSNSHPAQPDWDVEWKPLLEASLDTKLMAIREFPQLLVRITEAQDKLAEELQRAHGEFDEFALAIGLASAKEGK